MCGFMTFIYAVSTLSLIQKCRQSQHRYVKANLLLKNNLAFLGLQPESAFLGASWRPSGGQCSVMGVSRKGWALWEE